ncbi:MAG TPA: hypothetical protein VLF17_07840 [Candidatus Nitrosotenuis sp.]|nr:hypothetical protein [Candidatus Nitrosotenuis sp.]
MSKQNIDTGCEEQVIGDRVKICVSCGSTIVLIENSKLTCRTCGNQFRIKERKNGHHL